MRDWLARRGLPGLIGLIILLLPAWLRWPQALSPPLEWYSSRHVLLLPMLAVAGLWLVAGVPGWRAFAASRWRLAWACALAALVVWAAFSLLWGVVRESYPEIGGSALLQLAAVAAFAVVTACAGPRPRTVIGLIGVGLAVLAALTLLQVLNGGSLGLSGVGEFQFGPGVTGSGILQADGAVYYRPQGLMPHSNIHAGLLMAGTLAAGALWFNQQRWIQIMGALLAAFGVTALLLTFSRAALGGLAVGGLVALLLLWPRVRRGEGLRALVLAGGLCLIGAALVWAAYGPFFTARATASESVELRSIADRIVFTDFAVRAIGERPLGGVGLGNFPWQTAFYLQETFYDLRGDNVHNIYLLVAAELGLIGFVLFVLALVSGLVAGVRAVRLERGRPDADRAALLAIAAALLAVGLLDHYPATIFHTQALLWVCLAAAMRVLNNNTKHTKSTKDTKRV